VRLSISACALEAQTGDSNRDALDQRSCAVGEIDGAGTRGAVSLSFSCYVPDPKAISATPMNRERTMTQDGNGKLSPGEPPEQFPLPEYVTQTNAKARVRMWAVDRQTSVRFDAVSPGA
jgi:hypothetical protein